LNPLAIVIGSDTSPAHVEKEGERELLGDTLIILLIIPQVSFMLVEVNAY